MKHFLKTEQVDSNPSTAIVLKSGVWYTVSSFLTRAMGFITTPIFTRILTKKQFGDFQIFADWQQLFVTICGLEIYTTLNRARFDYKKDGELDSYISSSLILNIVLTSLLFCVYLTNPAFFENLLRMERAYIFVIFAYLYTYPAFEMFRAKQRVFYQYRISSAISLGSVLVCSLCALALALLMKSDRLLGRVLGQYVPIVIVGIVFLLYFFTKNLRIRSSYWRYALKLGIPLTLTTLGGKIFLLTGKLILQRMSSADSVAFLGIATTCSHIITIFVTTVNTAWAPWYYDKLNLREFSTVKKGIRILTLLVLFATCGLMLIGPELVAVLGGAEYKPAVAYIPPSILCGLMSLLVYQFSGLETFCKKPHYATVLIIISALLNIVLSYFGFKLFGNTAVCYSMIVCYLILIGMHYFVTLKMDIKSILPLGELAAFIGIGVAMMPMSLFLYKHTVMRWSLIGLLFVSALAIAWQKREELKTIIKKTEKKSE